MQVDGAHRGDPKTSASCRAAGVGRVRPTIHLPKRVSDDRAALAAEEKVRPSPLRMRIARTRGPRSIPIRGLRPGLSRRIARAPPVSLATALQVAGYPRAPLVGRRVLPTTAWVHLSVTEDTRRGHTA